jgi:hypothetical protein
MPPKLKQFALALLLINSVASANDISQLDGDWYSFKWKYGYSLSNGKGVAFATNSPNFKVGQEIVRLTAVGKNSFVGANIYKDGKFYKVKVTLDQDGKLLFEGEKNVKWEMEKIEPETYSQIVNSNSDKQSNKKDGDAPKESVPDIAQKIFNKKWSLSNLPCDLNGGTYTIYTNQPPTGATEYLAGKKNQSDQKQTFEFRTSDTEKNVLFRFHTIYAEGNKFVMQQVGDPTTIVSEVVEKITLQNNQKIIIERELRQIDFDQMLAGKVAYTKKNENTFKNLCK